MNKKNRADKKRAPERSQARAAKTEDSPVVLTDGDLDKVSGGVSRIPTTHGSDAGRAGGTHSSKTGGRTQ